MLDVIGAGGKTNTAASKTPTESPNTLRSIATARVVDLVSEGPIVGLVDGRRSVYFDDVPLDSVSVGKTNFASVIIEHRYGYPDQSVLPDFSDVETDPTSVDVKVVVGTPIVRTVTDLDADAARVTIRIPALWAIDSRTGNVVASSVAILIQTKAAATAYATVVQETIQGKTVSPYEKSYRLRLSSLGAGPWSIRLFRASADADSVARAGDLFWSSLTTIINHRLIYPDSAIIGVSCGAQSFGGRIPVRSYLLDGIMMQVPSNYDPVTRIYSGAWDGTFQTAFANNPAWVFYMLATNERFGLGEFLAAGQMDKWSLYAIGQYCDELVDNGRGGTEPRYTYNGVIADRDDAYRVLLSLASVFRGMVYWSSGAVFATADMPEDPVKLVTPANVVGGEFRYEGASQKARHSVVLITWNDPADGYKRNIEVVEDADAIEQFGYRPLELAAVGCTSRGQARRYGKWILETEAFESEVVTYTCSWDHADLMPGRLIEIADPAYAGLRMGGRIRAATSTTITLDDTIENPAGCTIDVVLPDGSVESRSVTTIGESDTLDVTPPFSQVPLVYAIWVLTSPALAPRLFRVVSITETDKHLFEISALVHSPGKYARVEDGLVVEDPAYTVLPSGDLGHPINLVTHQYLYDTGAGNIFGAVTASWTGASDPRIVRYEIQTARNGNDFLFAGISDTSSFDIEGISQSETSIGIQVRGLDELGRFSDWLTVSSVATTMFQAAPDDVTDLRCNVLGDVAKLVWSPVISLGLSHYNVRFAPGITDVGDATWGAAQVIAENIVDAGAAVAAIQGAYLVKAMSLADIESINPAIVLNGSAGLTIFNAVESLVGGPVWAGTLFDLELVTGKLRLVPAWVLSGSVLDLDFANARGLIAGAEGTPQSFLTVSRASSKYIDTAAGVWSSVAPNVLAYSDKGALIEEARTNVVLWDRDLTNAVWTKTNLTAAKDQTGVDGTAISASSILATAGNGTCLQAITLGSSARFQSCFVKRISGSGVVNMTMDNGATWTAVTVTAGWTRVSIPSQTLANPTVGFRIVTSGDKIAVDFAQNENGVFWTSPILTTSATVTRAADVVTSALGTWFNAAAGTLYVDNTLIGAVPGQFPGIGFAGADGASGIGFIVNGTSGDGTALMRDAVPVDQASLSIFTNQLTVAHKQVLAWQVNDVAAVANGGTVQTDAVATIPTPMATLRLHARAPGNPVLSHYLRRITYFPTRKTNAEIQALTA